MEELWNYSFLAPKNSAKYWLSQKHLKICIEKPLLSVCQQWSKTHFYGFDDSYLVGTGQAAKDTIALLWEQQFWISCGNATPQIDLTTLPILYVCMSVARNLAESTSPGSNSTFVLSYLISIVQELVCFFS